ncbi:MAG: MMPL family transporter [Bacteriovoracaceae bacterium]|jgi:uncharacterized protein|nr:MMPL family transporter [Bacteriovoracaceae bacterium]
MRIIILWSRDNPKKVIVTLLFLCIFSITRIPLIKIDPTIQKMLSEDHPEKLFYKNTEYKFTSDVITSIYIRDKNLFLPKKISLLEKLTWKFADIKEIYRVESLFSSPNFYSDGDMLSTVPLFDPVPETQEEMNKLVNIGLNNPLFKNQFLSPDKQSMTIVLYAEKGNHDVEYYRRYAKAVDAELKPLKKEFDQIFQLGIPKLSDHVTNGMINDQITFIPFAVLVVSLLLLIGLKTLNASMLPILTGTVSVLWTMAFMTFFNIEAQILISTVPIILFIIGSTEDCHMISEYMEGLHAEKNNLKAIDYMAKKVGLAITLTTITTVIGFLSITFNKIILLREFAIVAASGLALNFIVTATLTPVYLRYFGESKPRNSTREGMTANFYKRLSKILLNLSKDHKAKVCLIVLMLSLFGIWQGTKVHTDIDNLTVLKKSDPFIKQVNLMNENYKGGINNLLVVFKSDGDKPFKKAKAMKKIFEIHNHIDDNWKDGVSQSLAGTLALINRELNGGDQSQYKIPDQDNLISQYMLFLSKDDWEAYITPDYKEMNLIIRHKVSSSVEIDKVLKRLTADFKKILTGSDITFKFTSAMVVQTVAAKTLVNSQLKGIFLILLFIFVIIWILFLDIKAALLSLIPNIMPVIGLFGFMGFFDIALDIGTSIIATIAIGVATDDTLHFFTRYNDCLKIYDDRIQAMRHTLQEEIKPVMTTSISLAIGLAILGLSNFRPIVEFGILSSVTMIFALLSDLIVTPMLLLTTNQKEFISILDVYTQKPKPSFLSQSSLLNHIKYSEAKTLFLMGLLEEISPDEGFNIIHENPENHYLITDGIVHVEKKGKQRSSDTKDTGQVNGDSEINIEFAILGPGTLISQKRIDQFTHLTIKDSVTLLLINKNLLKRISVKNKNLNLKLTSNLHSLLLKPLI